MARGRKPKNPKREKPEKSRRQLAIEKKGKRLLKAHKRCENVVEKTRQLYVKRRDACDNKYGKLKDLAVHYKRDENGKRIFIEPKNKPRRIVPPEELRYRREVAMEQAIGRNQNYYKKKKAGETRARKGQLVQTFNK